MKITAFKILFLLLFGLGLFGCGQSVDEISIQPNQPSPNPVDPVDPFIPAYYLTNIELQGATTVIPYSPNRIMSIHSFGGTSLRTYSASPSFRMTSGIGID